jgi:hypothetical protein
VFAASLILLLIQYYSGHGWCGRGRSPECLYSWDVLSGMNKCHRKTNKRQEIRGGVLVTFPITVTKCLTGQLRGGRIYLGSWFQRVQTTVSWPCVLGRTSRQQTVWWRRERERGRDRDREKERKRNQGQETPKDLPPKVSRTPQKHTVT